jgi:hypothetical protein
MKGSEDQSTTSIIIGIRSNLAMHLRWCIELSNVREGGGTSDLRLGITKTNVVEKLKFR